MQWLCAVKCSYTVYIVYNPVHNPLQDLDPMGRLVYNPVKAHMAVGGQVDLITRFGS